MNLFRFAILEKLSILELNELKEKTLKTFNEYKHEIETNPIDISVNQYELKYVQMNLAIIEEVIRGLENKVSIEILGSKQFLN